MCSVCPSATLARGDSTGGVDLTAVTLSIFWEGTANTISPMTTQVSVFYAACSATNITPTTVKTDPADTAFKMGFQGCGVSHGIAGTIWAIGLEEECDAVATRVDEFLARGQRVQLNVLGLSRGGIAGLLLAKRLVGYDAAKVELSMCLFDPVPGNLVSTARWLDWFGTTTAAQCEDVSRCAALRRCVALYPHEPLPDLAFHAPVLART